MATRNIKIKRGDYYAHKINLPAENEDGDPIDWTAATFKAQIRKDERLTSPVIAEFAVDDSHTGDVAPYVLLTLESATVGSVVGTSDLVPRAKAFWDFQETRDGKPRTPFGGKVKITGDVTR